LLGSLTGGCCQPAGTGLAAMSTCSSGWHGR
jgi:hypothetical protein